MKNNNINEEDDEDKKEKKDNPYFWPTVIGGAGLAAAGLGALLVSPTMRRAGNKFMDSARRVGTKENPGTTDPVADLDSYITNSSDMAGGKIMGVIPVPLFMKGVRSSVLTPKEWRFWSDDINDHYKEFGDGPLSGYMRFLGEHQESEKKYNFGKSISPSWWLPESWRKSKAEKLIDKSKSTISPGATEKMLEVTKGVTDYDAQDVGNKIMDRIKEFGGVMGMKFNDISELNPEQQKTIYSGLDGYIKKVDPNLWKQKYITDFTQGATRIPTTMSSYSTLIDPLRNTQDALLYGGAALAGTGATWAAVNAYRENKKSKQKKDDQMKKQSAINHYINIFNKYAGEEESSGIGRWLAMNAIQGQVPKNNGSMSSSVLGDVKITAGNTINAGTGVPFLGQAIMSPIQAEFNKDISSSGKKDIMRIIEEARSRKGHFGASFVNGVASAPDGYYSGYSTVGGALGGVGGLGFALDRALSNGLRKASAKTKILTAIAGTLGGIATGAAVAPAAMAINKGSASALTETILSRISKATASKSYDQIKDSPSLSAFPFGTMYGAFFKQQNS